MAIERERERQRTGDRDVGEREAESEMIGRREQEPSCVFLWRGLTEMTIIDGERERET